MTEDDDDDLLNALGGLLGEQDAEDALLQAALESGEAVDGVDPALLAALAPLDERELGDIQAQVRPQRDVLPFRRWWVAAVPLAAAAAAAVFLLRPTAPALPRYELTVRSQGAQVWRSGEAAPSGRPSFREGTRFDFVLRPAARVEGEVELRAVRVRGEARTDWEPNVDRDPSGALRITGTVGPDLPAEPGGWTLVFEVGRPGEAGQRFEVAIEVLR